MALQTRDELPTGTVLMMMLGEIVAYDPDFDIFVCTTRGRVKRGNSRSYSVGVFEYRVNPVNPNRTYRTMRRLFHFRAMTEHEALEKAKSDKRVEALYRQRWQQEFQWLLTSG